MWIFTTLFSQFRNSKKFQIVIIQELAPEVVKFWKYQVLKININTNDRKIKECRLKKGSFILQSYFINHPHDFEFDQPNIQLKQKTNRIKCKQNKNKTKLKKINNPLLLLFIFRTFDSKNRIYSIHWSNAVASFTSLS